MSARKKVCGRRRKKERKRKAKRRRICMIEAMDVEKERSVYK